MEEIFKIIKVLSGSPSVANNIEIAKIFCNENLVKKICKLLTDAAYENQDFGFGGNDFSKYDYVLIKRVKNED